MPIYQINGEFYRSALGYGLDEGKTGTISISEKVREFVLYKGDKEVDRFPVTLHADDVNVITR